MAHVYDALVLLHLLGMAAVVGGYVTVARQARFVPGMFHGALTQLVTGLAIVGLREAKVVEPDHPLNHLKITVKIVVAAAVVVALVVARRRAPQEQAGPVHAAGGLALLNTAVAALW